MFPLCSVTAVQRTKIIFRGTNLQKFTTGPFLSLSLSIPGPIFRNESPPRCTGPVTLTPVKPIRWIRGTRRSGGKKKNFYAPQRRFHGVYDLPRATTCRVTWLSRIFSLPLFSSLTPSRGLTPSAANSFVESVPTPHRNSSRRGIFIFVGWNVSFWSGDGRKLECVRLSRVLTARIKKKRDVVCE